MYRIRLFASILISAMLFIACNYTPYAFYIDKSGNTVFKTKYTEAQDFHNGYAVIGKIIKKDTLYGIINNKGETIIEPRFSQIRNYSDGLTAILDKDAGCWGFINKTGSIVIEPKFSVVKDFHENVAWVATFSSKGMLWGLIDSNGKMLIEQKYLVKDLEDFSNGIGYIYVPERRYVTISFLEQEDLKHGVKNPRYENFKYYDERMRRWGDKYTTMQETDLIVKYQIDKQGNEKEVYKTVESFYHPDPVYFDGLTFSAEGFMNKDGKVVISRNQIGYDYSSHFSEGFLVIFKESNNRRTFGYMDISGRIIVEPCFDGANDFRDGLACVEKDKKYGYIDKTGKMVIEPQFTSANDFSEGLAAVKKLY